MLGGASGGALGRVLHLSCLVGLGRDDHCLAADGEERLDHYVPPTTVLLRVAHRRARLYPDTMSLLERCRKTAARLDGVCSLLMAGLEPFWGRPHFHVVDG